MRDMGHIDPETINWVRETYGDKIADALTKSFDGSPGPVRYEWAADKMRRFTEQLNREGYMGGNWTPPELQAVGWMTMSKMLGRAGQTAEEAIGAHLRNISSELSFGKGAPYHEKFPGYAKLPPEQQMEVTQEVAPLAADFAARMTGAQRFNQRVALGGWPQPAQPARKATKTRPAQEATEAVMGYNPSISDQLIASEEVARNYSNLMGLLNQQTEVLSYRPQENGKKFGIAVHAPELDNPQAITRFWDAFSAKHPDVAAGFTPRIHEDGTPGIEMLFDRGGDVMNLRVKHELHPSIKQILSDQGIQNSDTRPFEANVMRMRHDWEADPTGGSYLAPLTQSYGPDVSARVDDFRRSTYEPAIQAAIDKRIGAGVQSEPEEAGQEIETPSTPESQEAMPRAPPGRRGFGFAAAGLRQAGLAPGELGEAE